MRKISRTPDHKETQKQEAAPPRSRRWRPSGQKKHVDKKKLNAPANRVTGWVCEKSAKNWPNPFLPKQINSFSVEKVDREFLPASVIFEKKPSRKWTLPPSVENSANLVTLLALFYGGSLRCLCGKKNSRARLVRSHAAAAATCIFAANNRLDGLRRFPATQQKLRLYFSARKITFRGIF
jgi:hypothetical protein